jgi:hypothetical protein
MNAEQPPTTERYPFWGYRDLLLFAGMALPSLLLSGLLVRGILTAFHFQPKQKLLELLPAQALFYVLLFAALLAIFRLQYNRPFWSSLGWGALRMPVPWVVACGVGTALAVSLAGIVIQTPNTSNPMMDLMQDRTSIILMSLAAIIMGPLCEELAFRGFLQPLLVRSLGPMPGILLTAIPFGLLHFGEYGNSWRYALLVTLAGTAFGCLRQITGSTKASALMHACYNATNVLFFIFMQAQK